MKIAVNTRFLLRDRLEGIGWFTHEVVRRLVEQHPEHQFYLLFDRPYDESFVFGENVEPVVVRPQARHPLLWYWWFERSIPRVLRKIQADVFLSPDGYASLRARTPTVLVTHDLAFEHFPDHVPRLVRRYYRHFIPRYHQRAERIVAVSQFTKSDIERQYGIQGDKISVACNGVRSDFRPLDDALKKAIRNRYTNGKPYFFYLGSVHPRKNVDRLIQAFDRYKQRTQSETQLLIGGRFAWQSKAVKNAYDRARYKDDITFLGFVPENELPLLLGGASALAYVSLFEGFGVPLLEAMHCEAPIITSNAASMREVAGPAGYLVDPTVVDQIAVAMQTLMEFPEKQRALVAAGKTQREKYSWEQAAAVVWREIEGLGGAG
jgi:glycosyltransferase involved in cell wall biosynthesis